MEKTLPSSGGGGGDVGVLVSIPSCVILAPVLLRSIGRQDPHIEVFDVVGGIAGIQKAPALNGKKTSILASWPKFLSCCIH